MLTNGNLTSTAPCADGRRRAAAFGRALEAHLVKMRSEPGAYGQLGLSDLLEMREDCLREFRFTDVYRCSLISPRLVGCI